MRALFSGYGGEQFEVGDELAQPGIGTIVETRLVLKAEPPIELNYLLRGDARRVEDHGCLP